MISSNDIINKCDIQYRLFDLNDLKEMSKLYVESWRNSYWFLPKDYLDNMSYEENEEKWSKFIKEKDSFIYLAVDKSNPDKEIVCGMAAVKRDEEIDTFELATLHISQDYKGKRIGKTLMKIVAQHFLDNQTTLNCKCLYLWAVPINTPAVNLYNSLDAKVLKYRTEVFGGKVIDEVGLYWTDFNLILNK